MQSTLPWIIAGLSALAVLGLLVAMALKRPSRSRKPLPGEWSLTPRPVFSADERRVFRLLREALPHHVVMCKLPMVRFCQPTEAKEVRYWYELLGGISVNFAICSPNGRVLAAIDLETERSGSARSLQIKQAVLAACRIRYLRSTVDELPSASELQLLVPYSNQSSRSAPPPASRMSARLAATQSPAPAPAPRRTAQPSAGARNTLWNDSPVFSDSFFAPDSRFDAFPGAEPTGPAPMSESRHDARHEPRHEARQEARQDLRHEPARHDPRPEPRVRGYRPRSGAAGEVGDSQFGHEFPGFQDEPATTDIGGVVVDSPRYGRR